MPDAVYQFLESQPVIVVCIVLAAGYVIGNVKIRGFGLGSVTGVLFAALVFGHFGFSGNALLQAFGFALFMYIVGFEAGPQVFAVVRQDGLKYMVLTLAIAAAGFATALAMGRLLGLPAGTTSGALAGGMTTTPTLAAAQDAVRSGNVTLPDGVAADQVIANITTGYAITYLVGLVGVILLIKIVPRVLGLDVAEAAAELENEGSGGAPDARQQVGTRAYRVRHDSEFVGKTVREAEDLVAGESRCVRMRRDGAFLDPSDPEVRIEPDDCLTIVALLRQLKRSADALGPEIDDHDMLDLEVGPGRIVVTRRAAANRTLDEIGAATTHGCIVNRIRRSGVDLEPAGSLVIQRGDVLHVTAPEPYLQRIGRHLGHLERDIKETDLLTLLIGVAVGVAIGTITVQIAGIPIGLGMAGGVLLTGITLGYLRSVYPTFGRVPSGARWFISEFGLLLFMCGVGLDAGHSVVETLKSAGGALLIAGLVISFVPVAVGLAVGLLLFRMNLALLLGAITGAMTSTPAMRAVCAEARSATPALGYTGAYAIANVILAVAGYLIIRFEF